VPIEEEEVATLIINFSLYYTVGTNYELVPGVA
jgi:hypothetical protein